MGTSDATTEWGMIYVIGNSNNSVWGSCTGNTGSWLDRMECILKLPLASDRKADGSIDAG